MARSGPGSGSPALQRYPERQRRISVKIASDSNVGKYQSAGRRGRERLTARWLDAPDGAIGIGIGWPPHRHFDQRGEISWQNGAGG